MENQYLLKRDVKHLLHISEVTFWRFIREGKIQVADTLDGWHVFNRDEIMRLHKERGRICTVATWRPDLTTYYKDEPVLEVQQTNNPQWYWIRTESDALYKVYKNTKLYSA